MMGYGVPCAMITGTCKMPMLCAGSLGMPRLLTFLALPHLDMEVDK